MMLHTRLTLAAALAIAGTGFAHAAADTPAEPAKPAEPPKFVKKIENSRPMKATKRGLTKANDAIQRADTKGERAVRRADHKVAEKTKG